MLPGVALCSPFAQGDLDNLCGLYAALNAICLVSAPLKPINRYHARKLLRAGIDYLERRRWLSDAILDGMSLSRQRAVTRYLAKVATDLLEPTFISASPPTGKQAAKTDDMLYAITQRIEAGSAVIICLEHTYWHYTVISGLSASRVYLFDSDGLHWIERRSFGICGRGSQLRHCVSLASLVEVSVVST